MGEEELIFSIFGELYFCVGLFSENNLQKTETCGQLVGVVDGRREIVVFYIWCVVFLYCVIYFLDFLSCCIFLSDLV